MSTSALVGGNVEVDELQVVDLRALVAALETAQHARREVLANHPLLAVEASLLLQQNML